METTKVHILRHARTARPSLRDVAEIVALNNLFTEQGLTLTRDETFVKARLDSYRVVRDAMGNVAGCVCVDEYSPSLAEVVSLAVSPAWQGRGLGKELIKAAGRLAHTRGYEVLFAVSYSDKLFLEMGYEKTDVNRFPEKQARYGARGDEMTVAKKHCFSIKP